MSSQSRRTTNRKILNQAETNSGTAPNIRKDFVIKAQKKRGT